MGGLILERIIVVVSAKNEQDNVRKLIGSLARQFHPPILIVIVDDGSTDNTVTNIKELTPGFCIEVIPRHERVNGPNIAGTPFLAQNFNLAFDFIESSGQDYDYIMISGADDIYPRSYISSLLDEFNKNPNLMIASGQMSTEKTAKTHARGAGRIIRKKIWHEFGKRYWFPSYYWESGILYYGHIKGYTVRGFEHIIFHSRPTTASRNLIKYGRNFRAMSYPSFLILKRIAELIVKRKFRVLVTLLAGYIQGNTPNYRDKKFSKLIKKYQIERLKKTLKLKYKLIKKNLIERLKKK